MGSELWQRIRALRAHTKLSGEAFGAELDVSRAAVSQWEAQDPKKRTTPAVATIIDMARRFDAPMDWLLDDRSDAAWPTTKPDQREITLQAALPVVLSRLPGLDRLDAAQALLLLQEATLPAPDLEKIEKRLLPLLAEPRAAQEHTGPGADPSRKAQHAA